MEVSYVKVLLGSWCDRAMRDHIADLEELNRATKADFLLMDGLLINGLLIRGNLIELLSGVQGPPSPMGNHG